MYALCEMAPGSSHSGLGRLVCWPHVGPWKVPSQSLALMAGPQGVTYLGALSCESALMSASPLEHNQPWTFMLNMQKCNALTCNWAWVWQRLRKRLPLVLGHLGPVMCWGRGLRCHLRQNGYTSLLYIALRRNLD